MSAEQGIVSGQDPNTRLAWRCCRFGHLCTEWGLSESFEHELYFSKALDFYSQALQLEPELLDAWLGLGMLHLLRDDALQAMSCLQRARELGPDDPRVEGLASAAELHQLQKPKQAWLSARLVNSLLRPLSQAADTDEPNWQLSANLT